MRFSHLLTASLALVVAACPLFAQVSERDPFRTDDFEAAVPQVRDQDGRRFGEEERRIERRLPTGQAEILLSFSPIVKDAAPAVVNIYTKKVVRTRRAPMFDNPIWRRFFEGRQRQMPQERVQGSLGSGVIVRSQGIIITNNHVIEGADEVTVVLADRREFDAELVLADPGTDLAVLKIDTQGEALTALTFADSDSVEVGDLVLAIGNPFGIGQTVTSGIVSATARTRTGISDFGFFIQTDAAVNPGNSGGALVGVQGDLLGINTAIFSRSGGSNGIGFAIPAAMVESVLRAALNEGELIRPWLGLKGSTVTADVARSLGLDRAGGVIVSDVYPGGPAQAAGISPGDVILTIDGREVIDEGALNFRVATKQAGEQASLAILTGGFVQERALTLDLPPGEPSADQTELDGRHPFEGVTIANLNPRFNTEVKLDPFLTGVVVLKIGRRSPSARYGFVQPGDRLVAINGRDINTVIDLVAILDQPPEDYDYEVIRRNGERQRCVIVPNRTYQCGRP